MKNKAVTRLLKQIAQALASVTKAKSLALNLKSKLNDMRARMTIFSLLYLDRRSLLGSIRLNKLRTRLPHQHKLHQEPSNGGKDRYQIINKANMVLSSINRIVRDAMSAKEEEEEEPVEGFLPQSLLEELEFDDHDMGKSEIKRVRNSKEVEEGEDSRLEDRIDEVAELFINRFYNQIRMQRQDSFKSLSRQDSFKSCLSKQDSFKSCYSSPLPPQMMFRSS